MGHNRTAENRSKFVLRHGRETVRLLKWRRARELASSPAGSPDLVRVSDFTIAIETPKPTAAASAIYWPGLISSVAGRTIITTPTSPSAIAKNFQIVMRSPKNIAARIAVQSGMVNSIATTWPIGISVSA